MFEFEMQEAQAQCEFPAPPYDRWLSTDGETLATFHRIAGGIAVRFPDQADFLITDGCDQVECIPVPGTSEAVIANLQNNQVTPLLLNRDGQLVLHASAANCSGGALAFVGRTGRGKSTLAASFARMGHPFLTDDCLIISSTTGHHSVVPYRPYLRLSPESSAWCLGGRNGKELNDSCEKGPVDAGPDLPFAKEPVQLAAIYILGEEREATLGIESLDLAVALSEMLQHSFILDVEDKLSLSKHFERVVSLVDRVPCFKLDYPRRFQILPKVVDSLCAHSQQLREKLCA